MLNSSNPDQQTKHNKNRMDQTTILKKIIADQAILINKLQGYLVGTIKEPKKILKPSNKLSMAEARIKMEIFLKRQQKKNSSF